MELSYVILQNIAASGGATFSATNSVDLGNNSGWTITPIASRTLLGGQRQLERLNALVVNQWRQWRRMRPDSL
ncbi:MAG: hypothetical protein IPN33_19400 [Saprospiraceae bacterium]|nr:hypothetical protein [Saprospiraceae bacterium]